MDRWDVALGAVVVVGAVFVLTAPPEPSYSVHVGDPTAETREEAEPFVNMSTEAQLLFLQELEGDTGDHYEPPALDNRYVTYKGDTYRVSASASESSVFSVLLQPIGGILALLGGLGLVGRRLRQYYR